MINKDLKVAVLGACADGGFGTIISCAAMVDKTGRSWPGQFSVASDDMLSGMKRLASSLKKKNVISVVQLHHGGIRAVKELCGGVVYGPSEMNFEGINVQALSVEQISTLEDSFVEAARRCEKAGFDGVEIHGAHGYLINQFIDRDINQRSDMYGGSLENRCRFLLNILRKMKTQLSDDFLIGLRLSPENYGNMSGIYLEDHLLLTDMLKQFELDYVHYSLFNVKKYPVEKEFKEQSLLEYLLASWKGSKTLLVAAGNVKSKKDAQELESKGSLICVGKAAICDPDWPNKIEQDLELSEAPFSEYELKQKGLGKAFIDYLRNRRFFEFKY